MFGEPDNMLHTWIGLCISIFYEGVLPIFFTSHVAWAVVIQPTPSVL